MYFEWQLPEILLSANTAYNRCTVDYFKADNFQQKIRKMLRIWNDWAIYDQSYMIGLEAIFCVPQSKFDSQGRLIFDATTEVGKDQGGLVNGRRYIFFCYKKDFFFYKLNKIYTYKNNTKKKKE